MNSKNQSFREKLALKLHRSYVTKQTNLHKLDYLFWECTSLCNLACLHCGSDCKIIPEVKEMPAEDFLNVASRVAEKYDPHKIMIVVTGGEPLLRKDLPEIGHELKRLGYPWGMVTNGYAFTNELFRKLRSSGLRSVTVSLDGLQDSHDWMRGKVGSFDRALNAVKILAKEPGMTFDVVTCVNQRNFDELEHIKQLLINIGVKNWRIFMIDPIGRAATNQELLLNKSQFRQLLDYIAENRQEGPITASYGCDGFLDQYETKVRDGFFFCKAGIRVGSVLSNGDIGACPNIHRGFVQGNIYKDNFVDVWENKFDIYRNREVFKTGICTDCESWKDCRGDGMHLHEPENPNPLVCYNSMLKK